MYGMPTYEAFLDQESGKIWLGGCEIETGSPRRYCKNCRKSFGKGSSYLDIIEKVLFSIGGFDSDNHFIEISLETSSYSLKYHHFPPFGGTASPRDGPIEKIRALSEKEVTDLYGLIDRFYICEWPRSSIDKAILDGTQWSIKIKYQGRRTMKKFGNNKYPPYFPQLKKAMSTLIGIEL